MNAKTNNEFLKNHPEFVIDESGTVIGDPGMVIDGLGARNAQDEAKQRLTDQERQMIGRELIGTPEGTLEVLENLERQAEGFEMQLDLLDKRVGGIARRQGMHLPTDRILAMLPHEKVSDSQTDIDALEAKLRQEGVLNDTNTGEWREMAPQILEAQKVYDKGSRLMARHGPQNAGGSTESSRAYLAFLQRQINALREHLKKQIESRYQKLLAECVKTEENRQELAATAGMTEEQTVEFLNETESALREIQQPIAVTKHDEKAMLRMASYWMGIMDTAQKRLKKFGLGQVPLDESEETERTEYQLWVVQASERVRMLRTRGTWDESTQAWFQQMEAHLAKDVGALYPSHNPAQCAKADAFLTQLEHSGTGLADRVKESKEERDNILEDMDETMDEYCKKAADRLDDISGFMRKNRVPYQDPLEEHYKEMEKMIRKLAGLEDGTEATIDKPKDQREQRADLELKLRELERCIAEIRKIPAETGKDERAFAIARILKAKLFPAIDLPRPGETPARRDSRMRIEIMGEQTKMDLDAVLEGLRVLDHQFLRHAIPFRSMLAIREEYVKSKLRNATTEEALREIRENVAQLSSFRTAFYPTYKNLGKQNRRQRRTDFRGDF